MKSPLELYPYVEGYEVATLPENYQTAKKALEELEAAIKRDACHEPEDPFEALRFYAGLATDEDLVQMALKIQSRARGRMNQRLRAIEKE